VTRDLHIHGFHRHAGGSGPLAVYGSDAPAIEELSRSRREFAETLHPDLTATGAEVVWAVRHEMARTVEDVLARRNRALFLNASAAIAAAPKVAQLMAAELGRDELWQDSQLTAFRETATHYQPSTLN
jgi:glycerol-3-phosphate dehydrogenase